MTDRRVLAGLAFGAALLAAGVGATTLSLPDVAGAPSSIVSTELKIDVGGAVAAMNVSVLFDPSVATPGTATFGSAIDGTWTLRQNVVGGNDLRIVVYHSPTATFSASAANRVIVNIPWTLGASSGTSTALDFVTGTPGRCGLSNNTGVSQALTAADGRILVLTPPTRDDITGGYETLTNWESFQAIPFPFDGSDPFDGQYLTVSPNGNAPLSLSSSADGSSDGLAGFFCTQGVAFVANSVYFCNYTFQNDLVPGQNEATFRMRFDEEQKNAFAELLITGFTTSRLGGSTVTYPQLFEPSNLAANQGPGDVNDDLFLTIDMIDFDNTQAMTLRLTAVDVARFDKAAVDPLFSDVAYIDGTAGHQFTDTSLWLRATYGNIDLDPLDDVALPTSPVLFGSKTQFEAIPTYTPSAASVLAGTIATSTDPSSLGFFQEFGMIDSAPPIQVPGGVYRQQISAQLPGGAPVPDNSATIRMRMTEETQTLSASYQVESRFPRALNAGFTSSPAFGVNRPNTASPTTYNNYLAYPKTTNIETLLNSSSTDDILAFVGLIDFDDNTSGDINFSNARFQVAPSNVLLP